MTGGAFGAKMLLVLYTRPRAFIRFDLERAQISSNSALTNTPPSNLSSSLQLSHTTRVAICSFLRSANFIYIQRTFVEFYLFAFFNIRQFLNPFLIHELDCLPSLQYRETENTSSFNGSVSRTNLTDIYIRVSDQFGLVLFH